MSFIVAIDGPAGSGKGTLTKEISKRTDLINIDTGATYRCVTLAVIQKGYKVEETQKIIDLLDEINIELKRENGEDRFYLNGEDVSKRIREKDVSSLVSLVSGITPVRLKMVDFQRKLAEGKNVIMEGRDIGTYVFPNADVKIYLDASVEERAKRRFLQNQENGIEMSYEEIIENIKKRDYNDMHNKEIGALKKADDAILVDCSNLTIDEMVNTVLDIINKKRKGDKN